MKANLSLARSARLGLLLAAVLTLQPIVEAQAQSDPEARERNKAKYP